MYAPRYWVGSVGQNRHNLNNEDTSMGCEGQHEETNEQGDQNGDEGVDTCLDLERGHVCKLHAVEYATADEGCVRAIRTVPSAYSMAEKLEKLFKKESKRHASELKGP